MAVDLQAQKHQFEQALQREDQRENRLQEQRDSQGEDARDGQGESQHKPSAGETFGAMLRPHAINVLSAQVLVPLQRSVAECSGAQVSCSVLDELVAEVVQGLRAASRLPGDRWRMEFRVREELLSRTLLEIGSNGGCVSVELRTSSDSSYRTLVEGLPRLDRALHEASHAVSPARVFLISRSELP